MGGPNLEIFKFSIYLFVPLVALIHFGNPEWYREKVVPVRDRLRISGMLLFLPNSHSIETNFSLQWIGQFRFGIIPSTIRFWLYMPYRTYRKTKVAFGKK